SHYFVNLLSRWIIYLIFLRGNMVFQRKRCHVVRSGMAALLALGLVSGNMGSAFADPPPWAPAHGYRHKHKHDHHHHHHHKPKPKHKHGGPDYVVAPVPFGID